MLLPKLTSMTTGGVAMLLTNGNTFSSEFTMTLEDGTERPLNVTGQAFRRGGKILIETAFGKSERAGEFGVIWDVAANQGFVYSEALQGYAPINEAVQFTNLMTQVIDGQSERIEGHPIDKANVTVVGNDGQLTTFQISRSQDMGNLPLQIDLLTSPHPFTLALSKIQSIIPAEELFLPPDGFTKYESEAAMLDELAARQQSVLEGGSDSGGDYNQSGRRRHSKSDQDTPP